jgi:protein-S-isoprenylcysteine O-methyltransferase Ste14
MTSLKTAFFIRANEEPYLNNFGAAYEAYCRSVPGWIPRVGKQG